MRKHSFDASMCAVCVSSKLSNNWRQLIILIACCSIGNFFRLNNYDILLTRLALARDQVEGSSEVEVVMRMCGKLTRKKAECAECARGFFSVARFASH